MTFSHRKSHEKHVEISIFHKYVSPFEVLVNLYKISHLYNFQIYRFVKTTRVYFSSNFISLEKVLGIAHM